MLNIHRLSFDMYYEKMPCRVRQETVNPDWGALVPR